MSDLDADTTQCRSEKGAIAVRIEAKLADLGDFNVRRALPTRQRRMVGPFVFFDHMGPAEFPPESGIAVLPHPHIGIATITYLFEGEIIHRDSLGMEQPITPGAVNLMVAGRGIVHSERAGPDLHLLARLHGIQSWIALPGEKEEVEPTFTHYAAGDLPVIDLGGAQVRIIMGEAYGQRSPVQTFSRTLYLDVRLPAGVSLTLPDSEEELAFYVAQGAVKVESDRVSSGTMAVASPDKTLSVQAVDDSRVMVLGGSHLGPRHMYWNFVSTRAERIEQAKQDWRARKFPPVPGDDEFVPLPE